MKKIIITGGTGRFGQILKRYKTNHQLFFPTKRQFDILNFKKSENYLRKLKNIKTYQIYLYINLIKV